jgi:hypothetical protein
MDVCLFIDWVVTNIHIEVPDGEQYERLKGAKNKYGLTWRGMLVHATDNLDSPD